MKKLTALFTASALMCSMTITAFAENQMIGVDLWKDVADEPSMGNVSLDYNEKALYNSDTNKLQIATNPVSVSGYKSGLSVLRYDTTGEGDFVECEILETGIVNTGNFIDGEEFVVEYLSIFEIDVPSYMTKQGIEYISVQMQVPNTPMDGVIGDGYLDARLRINWDDMTVTTDENLVANSEMSFGEVLEISLESLGIKVDGDTNALSEVTKMHATKITSGEQYDLTVEALDGETNFDLYEVYFTVGDDTVSPTGAIDISFPYTSLDGIYRINDSGAKTTLYGTQNNENYTITTRTVSLFAIVNGEIYQQPQIEVNFEDIIGYWAEDYIIKAVQNGLFNGTSETTFEPKMTMSNEMAITVLYRMAGEPSVSTSETKWYSNAVAWGQNNNIFTGFEIGADVTREGLATMIYRFESTKNSNLTGSNLSDFTDTNEISSWAFDGLAWANAQGIVTGTTATTLSPQNTATRGEVATMFCRYLGV